MRNFKSLTKRILATLLVAVMLISAAPLDGFVGLDIDWPDFAVTANALDAAGKCGTNVNWSYDESTETLVISGTGPMYDYDGSYDQSPFSYQSISAVVIEDGVTRIGDSAFAYCHNLTSIEIPNSVTSIGRYAFSGCTSLTSIEIPGNVTSIDIYAFSDCTGLTSIEVPDGVTSIEGWVFMGCTGLTSIEILGSVTSIGCCAFFGCTSLTSIEIPDSVISIDFNAFEGCVSLTSIEIPGSVTSIGSNVFVRCRSLTSIVIPDSVTVINDSAFADCDNLTDVFYTGTQEQWQQMSIMNENTSLTNATIHYNYCPVNTDNHTEEIIPAVAPTYFNSGLTEGKKCSVCGVIIVKQRTVAKLTLGQVSNLRASDFNVYGSSFSLVLAWDEVDDAVGYQVFQLVGSKWKKIKTTSETSYEVSDLKLNSKQKFKVRAFIDGATGSYSEVLEFTVNKNEPTCLTDGNLSYSSSCGYSYSETYPATGHTEETLPGEESTCVTTGHTEGTKCSVCQEVLVEQTELPINGVHKSDSGTVLSAPTCTSIGFIMYRCLDCMSVIDIRTDDNLAHTEEIIPAVPATCTQTGLTAGKKCTTCGAITVAQQTTEKLGHSYNDSFDTTCNTCGEVRNVEFDETKPYIEVTSARGIIGDTATVKVRFINNPGIAVFKLGFEYDESVLSLEGVEVNSAVGGMFEYGTHAVWYSSTNTDFTDDFLTLTFRVLDDASVGTTQVSVTYDDGDIINYAEETVEFAVKSGEVEIYDYLPGDINNDGIVNNKDLTRLHKYLAGIEVEVVEQALDVNGDGKCSAADILRLMKYLAGEDVEINVYRVKEIILSATEIMATPGSQGAKLTATIKPDNAANKTIVWSSDDESVVMVNDKGELTYIGVGTTTVKATATDGSGVSASCTVKVNLIPVESVSLASDEVHLTSGGSHKLIATVSPSNATNKAVAWTSSNSTVATVDSTGTVRALKAGTAIITATTKDGSKKATCTVTVTSKTTEITVYPSTFSWYIGKTAKMTAVVKPEGARQDVTWSVSDTNYATIDANGNISILKAPGVLDFGSKKVTITATAKDGSGVKGTYELTIKEKIDVTGIEFAKDENGKDLNEKVFYVNEVFDPIINYSPEGVSEKASTYTSSNPAVAKVQEDGSILMVGIGKATITATSVDGGKKATWDIEVKEAKLTFNATEKKIAVGQETVTVLVSADPKSLVSEYGLEFHIEDESVLKFVKLESYGSSYYRATFAVMGSGATDVTASVGDIVATKEPVNIKVIDLKVDDYYDDLKVGSKVIINPKAVIGNTEIQTFYVNNIPAVNTPEVYGSIKYKVSSENPDIVQYLDSDWSNGIKEDGTLELEIKKELPAEGIYIDIEYVHGATEVRIEKRIHFVAQKIAMPKADFDYVKHLANTVASNSSGNKMQKVVNYTNTNVSSSDMDIEASNLAINILISAMKDQLIAEMGINSEDLVYELFAESTVETKGNADGVKAITCDEAAVESITVKDDGGLTYEVILELKDQQKMGIDEVGSSQYAKVMPVIDKAYADSYAAEMEREMGTNEKISIKYGTLNQTYRDGKVVFTINKLTDHIEKVEYYFKADIDFKNAQMVMSSEVEAEDMGTIDFIFNASFTTTVEEKLTYYNLTY